MGMILIIVLLVLLLGGGGGYLRLQPVRRGRPRRRTRLSAGRSSRPLAPRRFADRLLPLIPKVGSRILHCLLRAGAIVNRTKVLRGECDHGDHRHAGVPDDQPPRIFRRKETTDERGPNHAFGR